MTKNGFSVLIIFFVISLAIVIAGATALALYKTPETPKVTQKTPTPTTATTNSDQDIPLLYNGIDWNQPEEGEVVFTNKNNDSIKTNAIYVQSLPIKNYDKFIDYYTNELVKKGWQETSYASGPNGESYDYEKGGKYFSLGILVASSEPLTYKAFVAYSK